jgi:hypothetical protein
MSNEEGEVDRHHSPPKRPLSLSLDISRPSKLLKSEPPRVPDEQSEVAMGQRNHGLQRYLVAVEYVGTRFSGSQKQLACRTVVGVLEVCTKLCDNMLLDGNLNYLEVTF